MAVVVLEDVADGGFHEDVDALVHALVLKRTDHFQARPVTDMCQAGVGVATEIPLVESTFASAVEDSTPFLEFPDPFGSFLRVKLGHAVLVEVLAALHGVAEMCLPAVPVVGAGQSGGNTALGHHRVGLAQKRLADQGRFGTGGRRFNRSSESGPAGPDHHHVVFMGFVLVHCRCLESADWKK